MNESTNEQILTRINWIDKKNRIL